MARLLSLRYLSGARLLPHPAAQSLGGLRRSSGSPELAQLAELDVEVEGDAEVLGMRLLEEAIHAIVVRRSAPDWLPFVPGASYWVPRRKRLNGFVGRFPAPLTEEEAMSFTTVRGWPSSAYFVEGSSQQLVESLPNTKCDDEDS